jgi:hypothetical protein
MLDVVEQTTELPLDTAAKRALIEIELRKDASRSDREIARVVGCDHKTVAAHRAKPLPIPSPRTSSPPPGEIDEPEENHFLPESESLVLSAQPAVAVYTNRYGQIVIRQEGGISDDGDHFVYVCPQHVEKLITSIRKVAAEASR